MSDRRSLRLGIALAFLVLLTIWPPLHMVLAKTTGFAPSRLGGWGMYAGLDESYTGVEIFVVARGAELPAGVLAADSEHRSDGLRYPFEVHLTVVTPDGFRALDGSEMSADELDALWQNVRRIQAFPGRRSAGRLGAALQRLDLAPGGAEAVWVFTAQPGVDVGARRTEIDLAGWRIDADAPRAEAVSPVELDRFLGEPG